MCVCYPLTEGVACYCIWVGIDAFSIGFTKGAAHISIKIIYTLLSNICLILTHDLLKSSPDDKTVIELFALSYSCSAKII